MSKSFVHLPFEDDRFWSKVDFNGPQTEYVDSPCWIWTAGHYPDGYGFYSYKGKTIGAHRYCFIKAKNPETSKKMHVDHLCFTRDCVNVSHMEFVTPGENSKRAIARVTHCPSGHKYTTDNTYLINRGDGYKCRRCRTCQLAYHASKREKL